jgi:hypothetical protein
MQLIFDNPIKLVMLKMTMGAADHPQVVLTVALGKCFWLPKQFLWEVSIVGIAQ